MPANLHKVDPDVRRRRADDVSATVEAKLVDTLFDERSSIVVGQTAVIGIALLAFVRGHQLWLLAWAAALVPILIWRIQVARAYRHRPPSDPPMLWARRFAIGALLTSFTCGLASAASMFQPDAFLQLIIVTGQGAYVSVAAVRNSAIARYGLLQSAVPLVMLAIGCAASGEPFHLAYSVLILFHLSCVIQTIRFLSRRTRDLLVAQEHAAQANALLESLAMTDALTGALNRRGFDGVLSDEMARAVRHRQTLSLMLLDIDHFKALNDVYGHPYGDGCLRKVARRIRDTVRQPGGVVARYGGEEFAILLPATEAKEAAALAERIRAAIEGLALGHPDGVVTASIGHASTSREIRDAETLVLLADAALYRAKRDGRNRTEAAAALMEPPPLGAVA